MDPKTITQSADRVLAQGNQDPKKTALFFAGVATAFSFVTTLLSFLLGTAAGNVGGLSGLAMRSLLESGQVVLSMAGSLLLPFWQAGFLFAALRYAKGERVENRSLLEGLHRWGAVLRLNILISLMVTGVLMVCSYLATFIFFLSPFHDGIDAQMSALLETENIVITPQILGPMMPNLIWLILMFLVALLMIGLPYYYRIRMSEFALMDGAPGAFAAVHNSKVLAMNNRMTMFRLDLSFWWYYLLQVAISLITYGDVILNFFGVQLPVGEDVAFWITYLIALGGQFLLSYFFSLRYMTAYGQLYLQLKERFVKPITPPPSGTDYE